MKDTILIVDDSSFIVDGLAAILKKTYRTLAAYSGEDCLSVLRKETPSVIILDVIMEPIDGWETLSRIREDPATRHIPVLMFSARKISPAEAGKHLIRPDDFIQKPVSPQKIIESIERILARRDAHRVIMEKWQRAGVSRETLDEYLSLATSLEIDLSLCQNLKLQQDLAPSADQNPPEFRTLIAAIEERIGEERSRIAGMEEEMNAIAENREAEGTRQETGAGDRIPPSSAGSPKESPVLPSPPPQSPSPEPNRDTALPGERPPVIQPVTEPEAAGPQGSGIHAPPVQDAGSAAPAPSADLQERTADDLFAGDDLFEGLPVGEIPGDRRPGAEPVNSSGKRTGTPDSGAARAPGEGSVSGNRQRIMVERPLHAVGAGKGAASGQPERREAAPGTDNGPPAATGRVHERNGALPSEKRTFLTDAIPVTIDTPGYRHQVPASLDLPPALEESLPGAGTDVPLPAERTRSAKNTKRLQPADTVSSRQSEPGQSRQGIITRILAFFTRQKND